VIGLRSFDKQPAATPAFYDVPLRFRALAAHLNGIEGLPSVP